MRKDSKQGGYWEGKEGGWEKDSLRATADHRDKSYDFQAVSCHCHLCQCASL